MAVTATAAVNRVYSAYAFPLDWPEMVIAANKLEERLRLEDRPVAANMILMAYGEMRDRLLLLGQDMSKLGTDIMRREEKDSRVRPDTHGEGGKRLGDYLVVQPLAPGLLPGAIGINNEELLDNNVPWWPTNESGSSTQIGRKIFGLFYDPGDRGGGEPPDSMMYRQHALFTPAPAAAGGGGAILGHGIPARHFIERAAHTIEQEWLSAFVAIKADFVAKLDIALATLR